MWYTDSGCVDSSITVWDVSLSYRCIRIVCEILRNLVELTVKSVVCTAH